jgi:hypothetical protein
LSDDGADLDVLALVFEDGEGTGDFCGDFCRDLIGFEGEENIADVDGLAI